MHKKCEIEAAVFTAGGKQVVDDIRLAAWLAVDLEELRQFVLNNRSFLPSEFVFRLEEQQMVQEAPCASDPCLEVRGKAVFAFTIHGVILINACLAYSEEEAINPQIVRLLAFLKEKKSPR